MFDHPCKERHLAQTDREHREDLAEEIVNVFQNGIMDETELLKALSKRRPPDSRSAITPAPPPFGDLFQFLDPAFLEATPAFTPS
ncbi:MAG: hypothetical protein ABJB10_20325 [Mesorhizobium sp.]